MKFNQDDCHASSGITATRTVDGMLLGVPSEIVTKVRLLRQRRQKKRGCTLLSSVKPCVTALPFMPFHFVHVQAIQFTPLIQCLRPHCGLAINKHTLNLNKQRACLLVLTTYCMNSLHFVPRWQEKCDLAPTEVKIMHP